jgi:hypothetical protein
MLFELVASSLLTVTNVEEPIYEAITPGHLYSCGKNSTIVKEKKPGKKTIWFFNCFQNGIDKKQLKTGNTVQTDTDGNLVLYRWSDNEPRVWKIGDINYTLVDK